MQQRALPMPRKGLRRRPLDRLRFQIPIALALAGALPALVANLVFNEDPLQQTTAQYSLIASTIGALVALWLSRGFNSVPGVTKGAVHVLMVALSFSLVFLLIVALRLDFSRLVLFTGFTFTALGAALEMGRASELSRGHFWVVPFGSVERLFAIPDANWRKMDAPVLPELTQLGIVADLRHDLPDEWERMLATAALDSIPVYHFKLLEEGITGKVDIEHLSENTLGSLVPNRAYATIKAIGDFVVALLVLPFLLPFLAIVAIIIKLDSPGPVFFIQERVGKRAQPFKVIKFRTMAHRSPERTQAEQDDADGTRTASITQDSDPRVTRIGRFLRRSRVDELPQIFNILRGEMSWIGPRPEASALSQWYQSNLPFYDYRHIVRPGISGWAQVNQGHVAELDEVHDKLRYDFYYIKNFSIMLDLVIVAKTLRVMIGGFGSR